MNNKVVYTFINSLACDCSDKDRVFIVKEMLSCMDKVNGLRVIKKYVNDLIEYEDNKVS